MAQGQANNGILGRISGSICENAGKLHQLDLEWIGRRAAAMQFQAMLADLKDRLAQRRTPTFGMVEVPVHAA